MKIGNSRPCLHFCFCILAALALMACNSAEPETSVPTIPPTVADVEPTATTPPPEEPAVNLFASEPVKRVFEIEGGADGIELVDMNADGFVDLVAADDVANVVRIYLNDGQGEFQDDPVLAVGEEPVSVEAADFDSDGDFDLVVTNWHGGSVSILTNQGAGEFADATDMLIGSDPSYIRAADVDQDNDQDLIVTYWFTGDVDLLVNDQAGGFAVERLATLTDGTTMFPEIGDLNNDTYPDIVVAHPIATKVSVLLNDGAGAFEPAVAYDVGSGPQSVAIGDLNGDYASDLVIPTGTGEISILLNDGAGGFTAGETYEPGGDLISALLADMSGDGVADMLVTNSGTFNVHAYVNQGNGAFEHHADYPTFPLNPRYVYTADIDGDSIDEVVASTESRIAVFDFAD